MQQISPCQIEFCYCKANFRAGILNIQSAIAVASECSTEVSNSAQSFVLKCSTTSLDLNMFGIFSRSLNMSSGFKFSRKLVDVL